MTFITALVGGSMGFAAQIFSNSIRKVPLSRRTCLLLTLPVGTTLDLDLSCPSFWDFSHAFCVASGTLLFYFIEPWMHVGMFFAGCWAGNYYPKLERELVEDINAIRASKGMPPMVGSAAWIRYRPPEDEDAEISAKKV